MLGANGNSQTWRFAVVGKAMEGMEQRMLSQQLVGDNSLTYPLQLVLTDPDGKVLTEQFPKQPQEDSDTERGLTRQRNN